MLLIQDKRKFLLATSALLTIAGGAIAFNYTAISKKTLQPDIYDTKGSANIIAKAPITTGKKNTIQTIDTDTFSHSYIAQQPNPLLRELMTAIVEQGLNSGSYSLETLPAELRPFVRSNHRSKNQYDQAAEEVAEQEAEREAEIEAMLADDYVQPEPEFKCPDPEDPGPQWLGSHGRMILEEKGCTVY